MNQINGKVDMILKILTVFEPYLPKEEELQRKIKERGGAEECLKNEQVLNELARLPCANELSGRDMSTSNPRNLTREDLRRLQTPVEAMLAESLATFELKLNTVTSKLEKAIIHLKTFTSSRPYKKIDDPVSFGVWTPSIRRS